MSGRVKKEVEETDLIKPQPFHEENRKYVEDGDVILAQLGKQKSPMETTAKRLKIKRRYSDSKLKFVISGHAGKCIWQNRAPVERSNTVGETRSSALIRAEEVQSNLEPAFPSFVKSLVRSHVASCFWMGLPGQFCRAHLPHVDATVTLQDECGKEFKMKYIAYKTGLSAGWRQFCVAHRLFEGDVLVFQLIESCTFKVYVIRANDLTEVDGALGLLNLDAQIKQNIADNAERGTTACKSSKRKRPRSLPLAIVQKKNKKSGQPRPSVLQAGPSAEQSENDSEEVGSEVLEGFKLSLPAVQFRDIKSFEDFNILVDGLLLDSELSEDIRNKYYKLCCSQNAFLHDNLIKGVNLKLIAGIISETVNIADAMRACTLNTSRDEFATWDKALKASELFGMNVGFLRAKLGLLLSLAFDSEGATKTRRYIEARFKRVRTEDEIRNLEAKLVELKETYERYGADVERLKSKAEGYELKFQEQVLAPW
ncbi:B3 domain-containing protein Os01g0234100 isoform X2 [Populus alba]|uniref:B3 domain-containing protein Os01g0234100 isoform X2 n=1 Tax=Populus alba TaxID=43335 RepID=UPI0015883A9B|nr:B3 domain-containing protein Os01g0234100-like isoform X2 [Populus alba]